MIKKKTAFVYYFSVLFLSFYLPFSSHSMHPKELTILILFLLQQQDMCIPVFFVSGASSNRRGGRAVSQQETPGPAERDAVHVH